MNLLDLEREDCLPVFVVPINKKYNGRISVVAVVN
jgi:hypothetical protein